MGLLQEAFIEGYMLSYCQVCHARSSFCNCELVFGFAKNTLEVHRASMHLAGIPSLRDLLANIPFLTMARPVPPTGIIWNLIFKLNLMKCVILLYHYSLSSTEWEWDLLRFIQRGWEDSETADFDAASLVYLWVGCYSRQSYIGETAVGLLARFTSHLNAWLGRRRNLSKTYRASALYGAFSVRGLKNFCMLPVFMWVQDVSKYARLHWEAFAIWERQPCLNKMGRSTYALTKETRQESIYVPKKGGFRLVARLRKLEKQRREMRTIAIPHEEKAAILRNEMACRSETLNTMVRLARRPLRYNAEFATLGIVRNICALSVWKVGRLFRAGAQVFTGATKSIYFKNLSLVVRQRTDIVFERWTQTNEAFQIPRITKELQRVLRHWTYRLAQLGLYLILRIRHTPGFGDTVLGCFENTNKWGRKLVDDCVCNCAAMNHLPVHRVEGHVLCPFTHFLQIIQCPLPPGWTIRSRIPSQWRTLEKRLSDTSTELEQRVHKRLLDSGRATVANLFQFNMPSLRFHDMEQWWTKATQDYHFTKLEECIRDLKALLQQFVVGPVDKIRNEATVTCASCWASAVQRLAGNYRPVVVEDYSREFRFMFRRMQDIPRLVYGRLQHASKHRFGALKAWLKGRCLVEPPLRWSDLAWRPLCSYAAHHWKEVLSYPARFALYVIHVFSLGWAIDDPRQMLEKVAAFNSKWRTMELLHHREFFPEWDVVDIEDFFPRTPRADIRRTVERWVAAIRQRFPQKPFFCVAKVATHETLLRLPKDGGGRNRTARLRKKMFMADRVTRGEIGMDVRFIPRIVDLTFATDIVETLGRAFRADDGLNIGDPSAATCASLNASTREHDLLQGLPAATKREIDASTVTARWQDDWWQVRIGREIFDASHNTVTHVMVPGFYGQTLNVKRVREPRAFGFLFWFNNRRLLLIPIQKYVQPLTLPWVCPYILLRFNTGCTFTGRKRVECELRGFIISILDKTNGSRREITTPLLRLGAEMILRRMPPQVLIACMRSITKQAASPLPQAWDVLVETSHEELRQFAHEHDLGVHDLCRRTVRPQEARWDDFDMILG